MNVILILIDSLNKRHLEPYGAHEGLSPNMKRFASRAVQFENHYVGSLPCMPARREIYSGHKDFLWRPWGHLEAFDQSLPEEAAKQGYKTQLITDHYHYWEHGANGYKESFQGLEMIRGHEIDPWKTDPVKEVPEWVEAIEKFRPGQGMHYYRNVKEFQDERDFFPAKVMTSAAEWLEHNHGERPYFLQVESFDVHEPFHLPEPYRSMWTDHTDMDLNCWPPYQDPEQQKAFFEQTTPEELDFIRGQYMGKMTMVDKWLGTLMDKMDQLSVWEDTLVILTTDHGHDLGEREAFGKQFPHWDSHANIPLLVRHPSQPTHRVTESLTSTVDLYATILESIGKNNLGSDLHSRSLLPVLKGTEPGVRNELMYGTFGKGACCTDGEYVLMQGYDNDRHPLYMYSGRLIPPTRQDEEVVSGGFIPGISLPVWRIPVQGQGSHPSILYSRQDPLGQEQNRIDTDPKTAKRMRELLIHLMEEEGSPSEQFKRLGLR